MTERFSNAVKSAVADGVVTPEEKDLLIKVAEEENLNLTDAEIYIVGELKKVKVKQQQGTKDNTSIVNGSVKALETLASLATIVIPLIMKGKK